MSSLDDESGGLVRQKRLFSRFLSKDVPPLPLPEERRDYPVNSWNLISRVMFWWLTPMLRVGYKRTLQPEDLFVLTENQKVEQMYERFVWILHKEALKNEKRNKAIGSMDEKTLAISFRTLCVALFKTFWVEYIIGSFELLLANVASALSPLLQKKLTNFVEAKVLGMPVNTGQGVGYAVGCCLLVFFVGVMTQHFFNRSMIVGAKVKAVLTKALLEKSYRLDAEGRHYFSTGKITSIMGTDLNRIDLALGYLPFAYVIPFPVIICIVLLIVNIGVASLVGIAVFIMSVLILGASVKTFMSLRTKANKYTDHRVSLTKELLKNFKIIKFYSWEDSYERRMKETRTTEMGYVYRLQSIRNIMSAYAMSLPTLSSAVAFCTLYAIKSSYSIGSIFSSLTLFQVLAQQFMMLPIAVAMITDLVVGFKRISAFLSCGEVPPEGETPEKLDDPKLALKVVDGSFNWQSFEETEEEKQWESGTKKKEEESSSESHSTFTAKEEIGKEEKKFVGLKNIDLEILKGEFVVVTGHIGSGKSSLLQALAGFMHKQSGHIYCGGSLLLCGYPWVQNATVRENITFGHPFDRQKYSEIVDACCLEDDFRMLPGSDNTQVGERGVTLSGGQKARINLARAVYADSDIILLDDVLSAVDAKVGKKIMDNCILGLLKNKTRILATHQLSLIGEAERMIFLNGDGTLDVGTADELIGRNQSFVKLMEFNNDKEKTKKPQVGGPQQSQIETVKDKDEVQISRQEERAVNSIKLSVYQSYLKQGSGIYKLAFLPILIVLMTVAEFCSIFTNNWLSYWAEQKFVGRSQSFYMGIYLMFAFLAIILLIVQFWLLVYFSNTAARRLNVMATERLLHVPMSFIDITPMGQILNRFTKDTDVCDNELISQFRMFLLPFCTIVGIMILCIVYLPYFAIAVPALVFMYIAVASFYQASAREVKRLEAVQRSFVFSHFGEALGGMQTIKALRATDRFMNMQNNFIDKMNEAYFLTIANQRWLSINLSVIATALCFIIAMLCCFRVFNIGAATTGLLLSYVLTMANLLSLLLRALTQIENEMNSVERLNHYAVDLEQEDAYEIPERDPSPEWPERGEISFEHVSMRYRPELPYVLRDVSMNINARERIGVCGRTGAGKSTIMSCMYRLVKFDGKIHIDGVDIDQLGLHTLRSRLSIIPQDPALFAGSIRANIDPFNEKTDDELWDALRRSGLIGKEDMELVKTQEKTENMHKFHLEQYVEDDGANFSLGERQLLALARALVRQSKILILDEATSSVDYETDSKIQHTISSEFPECTILCVAHRLRTILTYNRIVVLDQGEIREFDAPLTLFEKKDGIFRSMCDQSGITKEDFK
ncbi:DEKNAAC100140 [Brettanomyces naardenensis]|uniref:DEKNAAC100140 n=1 Tax=Brettanomyces naardenensis TaxID=13370 RepID=A0A448YFX7_BRENA|nr:DEKNAAC100140 [Brettanomyces naardenensis]